MNEQTCLQACTALMKRYHKCDLVAYVLVLKLNYEKSYDRISWDFLFEIISSSGLDKFGLIGLKTVFFHVIKDKYVDVSQWYDTCTGFVSS